MEKKYDGRVDAQSDSEERTAKPALGTDGGQIKKTPVLIYERRRPISAKQHRAILLRVQGLSLTAIARDVQVNRVTVSRWFSLNEVVIGEFRRRLEEALAWIHRFDGP